TAAAGHDDRERAARQAADVSTGCCACWAFGHWFLFLGQYRARATVDACLRAPAPWPLSSRRSPSRTAHWPIRLQTRRPPRRQVVFPPAAVTCARACAAHWTWTWTGRTRRCNAKGDRGLPAT